MCLLSDNINDYHFVAQGKTTIPNVDDGEEFVLTDVSPMGRAEKLFNHIKIWYLVVTTLILDRISIFFLH